MKLVRLPLLCIALALCSTAAMAEPLFAPSINGTNESEPIMQV